MIYCLARIVQAYQPIPSSLAGEHEAIILFQMNLLYANADPAQTAMHILALPEKDSNHPLTTQQPDILVFQEATVELINALDALRSIYPYQFINTQADAFGSAVFSKFPFVSAQRIAIPQSRNHYSIMEFLTPQHAIPLTLLELHTIPPVSVTAFRQRNHELGTLAKVASHVRGHPVLLVGDFNITPYSTFYKALEAESGLFNAMRGFMPIGTWPSGLFGPLRIPIDHLLISGSIKVGDKVVGPDLFSDHLPVTHILHIYR
jgi:endonuclease/exonuclease/phosphatase (EEP) superfamily protein YafD